MASTTPFKTINFTALLRETLTSFFSFTKAGQPTSGYKFSAACLSVLIQPWAGFETFRQKWWLIANCKWQVGQLQNVLNALYDPTQNRITVTQSVSTPEFLMQFAYPPVIFLGTFDAPPMVYLDQFGGVAETEVTISVPAGVDLPDLTAAVATIALDGIDYQIVTV